MSGADPQSATRRITAASFAEAREEIRQHEPRKEPDPVSPEPDNADVSGAETAKPGFSIPELGGQVPDSIAPPPAAKPVERLAPDERPPIDPDAT